MFSHPAAALTPQQMRDKALIDGEIVLLNMCFDDIESYVGHIYKLQRARCQNSARIDVADDNISVAGVDKKGKEKKKRRFIFKKRTNSPKSKSKQDMPHVTSGLLLLKNELQTRAAQLIGCLISSVF